MTTLHESPCGQPFSTAEDAASHQWHCDQCAGVLEALEAELDAMDSPLAPVYGAALPKDAPGAWIRAAMDAQRRAYAHTQPMLPGLG